MVSLSSDLEAPIALDSFLILAMKFNLVLIILASIHLPSCSSDSDLGYEALKHWVVQAGGQVGETISMEDSIMISYLSSNLRLQGHACKSVRLSRRL